MVDLSAVALLEISFAVMDFFQRSDISDDLVFASRVVIDDISPSGDFSFHIVVPGT